HLGLLQIPIMTLFVDSIDQSMSEFPRHVEQYVDYAAHVIGLSIAPEYRSGVIENVETLMAIAQSVMEFPLPADLEAAPVFYPDPRVLSQRSSQQSS
ncbi:MAG TPA: DUF4089 domain-containing protein, partial [Elainellaceae cyanobacterium]